MLLHGQGACNDAATRKALLDFSLHLAAGSHEDAFRAVAAISAPSVWEAMAHVALRSRRLDVAGASK